MRHWTFWEWLAYACLLVGAVIIAADTGLRLAPDLAAKLPDLAHEPAWGFAPLSLMLLATAVLAARAFGWVGSFGFLAHPLTVFLERDSQSDQFGIQTFPGVVYIQIAVTASRPIEKCRGWIVRVEYRLTNYDLFAVEHNERHPCQWSKHGGADNCVADLKPNDPPLRLNVAVYDESALQCEPVPGVATPSNLLPLLQRTGIHRFTLRLVGEYKGRQIAETKYLDVDWRGPGNGAFISLSKT